MINCVLRFNGQIKLLVNTGVTTGITTGVN